MPGGSDDGEGAQKLSYVPHLVSDAMRAEFPTWRAAFFQRNDDRQSKRQFALAHQFDFVSADSRGLEFKQTILDRVRPRTEGHSRFDGLRIRQARQHYQFEAVSHLWRPNKRKVCGHIFQFRGEKFLGDAVFHERLELAHT